MKPNFYFIVLFGFFFRNLYFITENTESTKQNYLKQAEKNNRIIDMVKEFLKSMVIDKVSNMCEDVDLETYCKNAADSIIADACCDDYGINLKAWAIVGLVGGFLIGGCWFAKKCGLGSVCDWICESRAVTGRQNERQELNEKA